MFIGIQLYSFKDIIKKDGLEKVLIAVKDAGFDGVEFAGFYDYTPDELKGILKSYNLKASGAHIGIEKILNEYDKIISYAKALDMPAVIVPYADMEKLTKGCADFYRDLNDSCKKFEKDGITLCYHNHNHELDSGTDYLKKIMANVDGLKIEADIYWIKAAGLKPLDYIKSLGKRLKFVHLKELSEKGINEPNPVLGSGVTGAGEVIRYSLDSGIEWVILETEKTDCDASVYITQCCDYIKGVINSR